MSTVVGKCHFSVKYTVQGALLIFLGKYFGIPVRV